MSAETYPDLLDVEPMSPEDYSSVSAEVLQDCDPRTFVAWLKQDLLQYGGMLSNDALELLAYRLWRARRR